MANNPIDKKKSEKLKIMGNSIKEYLKTVLILFITVAICTYLALNIIFTGYLPAEVIFPTSPCMPPYMSNDPAKCHRSYNLTSPNNKIDMENEKALYAKCRSNEFSKKWLDKKSAKSRELIDSIQMTRHKHQHIEYRAAQEFIQFHGAGKSNTNIIMKFFKLTLRVLLAKTFINTRTNMHTFHSVVGGLFSANKITFGILLIILIFMMNNGLLLPLILSFFTIINIIATIHWIFISFEDFFWTPFFAMFPLIGSAIFPTWIAFWIMRDFVYHYFIRFIFHKKTLAILSCKLKDYWPVVSTVFVFFSLLKASIYLDNSTVTCMWIVFIIMLYMNKDKILKSNPKNDVPVDIKNKGFGCDIDI